MTTRRHFTRTALAALAACTLAGAAFAQDKGPIKLIVPFVPGGPTPTVARPIAPVNTRTIRPSPSITKVVG